MSPARWPAVAFGAASALYSSWLLGPWLNPRLGLTTGLASDLAAADQPWHELFRYCDVAAGSLSLLGSARMLIGGRGILLWPRLSRAERAAWLFVAVFAISTIFDGYLTALPCAPSIDAGCPSNLDGGLSAAFDPHTLTSAFAVIGGVGSIVSFWLASRPGSADRTWSGGLAVGSVVVNLGLLVELARDGGHEGIWQRIELLNLAAWLIYAAVRSQQSPRTRSEPPDDMRRIFGFGGARDDYSRDDRRRRSGDPVRRDDR
ncbi:hypothetical protein Ais01nite_24800 [Asanoa ishikariensis]|uniref:DUF998 domain-containing protein n=1 Tax=Asanoa ishikariensis TaxID=137265 RepID=A0A1H3R4Z9_9ACTN|nr:DUF998 domain-containing protein [Asanoa ishikariensis]GIF64445.1 hypothetical protein Ais01nite_24800 [Asanoa ishikariensis]SDZ20298.1 Protein of unknown function [Asanoa ishikariensis]